MSRIVSYFKPISKYKYRYWIYLFMAVIGSMLINYISSYMNKYIFNGIEYNDYHTFALGCKIGIVLIVVAAAYPFTRYFHIRVVRYIVYDLKTEMVKSLTNFKMNYFDSYHSADAMQKISNDAESMKTAYFTGVFRLANTTITGTFSIIMMLKFDYRLAIVSMLIAIVSVAVLVQFSKRIKRKYSEVNNKLTNLTGMFSDILNGMVVIKLCKGSGIIFDRYNNENEAVKDTYNNIKKLDATMDMSNFLLGTISSLGTIFVGIIMVRHGATDYGTVMAIVALQSTVSMMFKNMGNTVSSFMSSVSRYERIDKFINEEKEENKCELRDSSNYDNIIQFDNVSFSYDGCNNVLENVSFGIKKGERLVLEGQSGCGKSTIFKLILGLYNADKGTIIVGGMPIETYSMKKLRSIISYVSQDCYMFDGSAYENIACADRKASRDDVVNAARIAGADEFINGLENGYDTEIASGGTNISGGQRQRIALARAFLKKAPIILFDEVTSALDSENESRLYESIETLPKDVTILMITHRVDTVRGFDGVMEVGK